jgi:hypothetical protein
MRCKIVATLAAALLLPAFGWAGDEPASAAEAKAEYTEQLLDILGKTRSTDTFLVTLSLLVEGKADIRVIPEVIANAERLGIFDDHLTGDDTPKSKLASEVQEMILQIQKPGNKGGTRARYSVPPPPTPTPNQYNAPSVVGSISNKPPAPPTTPILPAVKPGQPLPKVDPPSEAEILRALRKTSRGIPYLYAEYRDDVQIVTEKITDKLDDPRFFPLVGPAQLRHVHWKCTVSCNQKIESSYPFPFQLHRPNVEVVYIDRDQLHLAANTPDK